MLFSNVVIFVLSFAISKSSAIPVVYNSNSTAQFEEAGSTAITGWAEPFFPRIHHTCNETNARMLTPALKDSLEVSAYAKNRLLNYGKDNTFYQRWFGNGSIFTVYGVLDYLVESAKDGILYRCDDVDGQCATHSTTWPGYHRSSAPKETVICDLFYNSKKPLSTICSDGTILEVGPKHYAGVDLLHRYLHVPSMSSDGYIAGYAEELSEVLDYAKHNSTYAVRNVDSYLHYLADVYSTAVIPGGCMGSL